MVGADGWFLNSIFDLLILKHLNQNSSTTKELEINKTKNAGKFPNIWNNSLLKNPWVKEEITKLKNLCMTMKTHYENIQNTAKAMIIQP